MPLAAHRVAKGVNASLGIDFQFVAMHEHHAGGAYGRGKNASIDDSVAYRPGGTIAGPAHDKAIGRKAQGFSGRGREFAGYFLGFITGGEKIDVEFQGREQFLGPFAFGHVQQQHAAGIADFGGIFAGQAAADFVLGQKNLAGFVEMFRFVVS